MTMSPDVTSTTPRVSIVTISFNQASFLERAMRSVLDQDYSNIEYIVVDPGSTDGSRELIELYSPRISKTILERDKGPADGLNKGFAAATGDIFGYINADDALLPGAISELIEEFRRAPKADVIFGHGYKIDQNGRVIRRIHSEPFSLRRRVYGGGTILQQSTFFKREAFAEVGGFNVENRTSWDGELMVDLGLRGKRFKVVNRYWSLFTIHPDGISGSGRLSEEYMKDESRMFRKITGRERQGLDNVLAALGRIAKHLGHPVRSFRNVVDRINPPSKRFAI